MSLARAHPYIPNSAPRIRQEMLEAIGVESTDDLYAAIPERLRLGRLLEIEPAVGSELELRRRVEGMLDRNVSARDRISFLGGGCWPHYVPAVVDEIIGRSEFLTAYYGETYSDHGKLQAFFEFASMVGDLVECDVVSQPTYDWGSAAASAILMAGRLTGRTRALVPALLSPERRSIIAGTCGARMTVEDVPCDAASGALDLAALDAALGDDVACVYLENPAFLGTLEPDSAAIAERAHAHGALAVVGVDATSLGVLEAPPRYGADLVCGELQGLGIHMHYGGGTIGFIASADDERIVAEYPTFLVGAGRTVDDEWGFGEVRWDRMAYVQRGEATRLHRHHAMPVGDRRGRPSRTARAGRDARARHDDHAAQPVRRASASASFRASARPRSRRRSSRSSSIDLDGTGRTVAEVNRALAAAGIHGPLDLSRTFAALGQSALVCVTEVHTQEDIDRLADALAAAIA